MSYGAKSSVIRTRPLLRDISRLLLITFTAQTLILSQQAYANPINPTVANGQASFNTQGTTLTVTNTPGTIINWQGFSIGANEATRFVQQSASSAVLNRVTGATPSSIFGVLQSNGQVYLINPNGIVFGAGATVDVNGLVASTLNLSDADFLAGNHNYTAIPGAQNISNAGNITAQSGGRIYLIAPNVENSGIITAPNGEILLAAGNSVQLVNSNDPNLRVSITAPAGDATNLGQLIAQSGSLGLFGAMVRNAGQVSADSATMQGGKIVFKSSNTTILDAGSVTSATGTTGGSIQVQGSNVGLIGNASVDASGTYGGGTVLIGGDAHGANLNVQNSQNTFVGTGVTIKADAIQNGNGGKVVVWSDNATQFGGNISARGGARGGNGGWVEVSGKHWLGYAGLVDTRAPLGITGSLLLDPMDITISNGANTASMVATPALGGTLPTTFADATTLTTSNLNITTLVTQLALSNVTVDTTSASGLGVGNITVQDSIAWASANSLTLNATGLGAITVNALDTVGAPLAISNTGLGGLVMQTAGGGITLNGGVTLTGGAFTATALGATSDVLINSAINTGAGAINLTAGRLVLEGAGGTLTTTGLLTTSSVGGTTLNNANSVGSLNATNSGSGNINLTNTAATLTVSGITQSGGGNITIANTGNLTVGGPIAVTSTAPSTLTLKSTASTLVNGAVTASGVGGVLNVVLDHGAGNSASLFQTLTLAGGNVDVQSAGVSGTGTLAVYGGVTGMTGSLTASALKVWGGTLNLNSATPQTFASLDVTSGILGGTSPLSVNTMTWSGGTVTGTGTLDVNTSLGITGSLLQLGRTLNNKGTATETGTNGFSPNFYLLTGGVINNALGATWTFQSNAYIVNNVGNAASSFNNSGTLIMAGGTGNVFITNFTNSGTFNLNAGSINFTNSGGSGFNGNYTATSTTNIVAGASLLVDGYSKQTFALGSSLINNGTMNSTCSASFSSCGNGYYSVTTGVFVSGAYSGVGTIGASGDSGSGTQNGGGVWFAPSSGAATFNNIIVSGHGNAMFQVPVTTTNLTIMNNASMTANPAPGATVSSVFNWSGGAFYGTLNTLPGSTSTLTGNGILGSIDELGRYGTGGTWNNAGAATWISNGQLAIAGVSVFNNSGTVNNNTTAATISNPFTSSNMFISNTNFSGAGVFNNTGIINNISTTLPGVIYAPMNNSGTVNVNTGTLTLANPIAATDLGIGVYNVGTTGTLNLISYYAITGTPAATVNVNGGVLSLSSATPIPIANLNLTTGAVNGAGNLTVTNSFIQGTGVLGTTFSDVSINQTTGALTIGSIGAVGALSLTAQTGMLTTTGAISSTNGPVTLTANKMALSGGTINAGAGGVTLQNATATNAINIGSVVDTATNTLELSQAELATITTSGTLTIGSAANSGAITVSAPLLLANNTTLINGSGGISINAAITATGKNLTLDAVTGALAINSAINAASITGLSATGVALGATGTLTSSAAGNGIVLNTGTGNFVNNAGVNALTAGGGGRWLIYSVDPALDTNGGLNSNNADLWGQTYASYAPGSVVETGDRYIHSKNLAPAPTVAPTTNVSTISSIIDAILLGRTDTTINKQNDTLIAASGAQAEGASTPSGLAMPVCN